MGQAKLTKAPTSLALGLEPKNAPTVYMVEKKLSTFVVIYYCLKHGKWWVLVILIDKIYDSWIRDLEFKFSPSLKINWYLNLIIKNTIIRK